MPLYYTRTGDKGETGLFGGKRLSKSSVRVDAYGSVDELNSAVGLARALLSKKAAKDIDPILAELQRHLFTVGADIASPEDETPAAVAVPRVSEAMTKWLEEKIDSIAPNLKPLQRFILPGGTQAAAALHLARSIARRAERKAVALAEKEKLNPEVVRFLNRTSSLLFVLARWANAAEKISEEEWSALSKT